MIKQKVHQIQTSHAEDLAEEINEFNETHNTFATQIFPPTNHEIETMRWWTAFIHYREAKK